MREDRKKHRHYASTAGPSFIRKDVLAEGSCTIFIKGYQDDEHFQKTLKNHKTWGLDRPDPMGLTGFGVAYSLNKKQRWLLPKEAGERIEEMQIPEMKVRVTAAHHRIHRAQKRVQGMAEEDRSLHYDNPRLERNPTIAYHEVASDGRVVHNVTKSKKGGLIRNLIKPDGLPKRTRKDRGNYRWDNLHPRAMDVEAGEEYQKLHIRYSTLEVVERPATSTNCRKKGEHAFSYDYVPPAHKIKKSFAAVDSLEEQLCDMEADEVAYVEPSIHEPCSIASERLVSSCIVVKEKMAKTKRTKEVSIREETLTPYCHSIPSTSGYLSEESSEDEEEEEVVILEDFRMPVSVTTPAPMFTSLDNMPEASSLRVSPPTWFVHRKDAVDVLGRDVGCCVVAKRLGDTTRLFMIDECACKKKINDVSSADFAPLEAPVEGDFCPICCTEFELDSAQADQLPFALECGHFYCVGCWLAHVSACLASGRLPTPCMSDDCKCTLGVAASRGLLDTASFASYSASVETALLASQTLVACPECKTKVPAGSASSIPCPCGVSICGVCSSIDHWPLACDAFDQYVKFLEKSGFTSVYSTSASFHTVKDVIACPNCARMMQRSEGCNHMHCLCDTDFCYVCGGLWSGKHYNCDARNRRTKKVRMYDVVPPSRFVYLPHWGDANLDILQEIAQNAEVPLIDVLTNATSASLLTPSLLTVTVAWRMELYSRRKEIASRLALLGKKESDGALRILMRTSLAIEGSLLNSKRDPKRSVRLLDRLRFEMARFLNTRDDGRAGLERKAATLHEGLRSVTAH